MRGKKPLGKRFGGFLGVLLAKNDVRLYKIVILYKVEELQAVDIIFIVVFVLLKFVNDDPACLLWQV